MLPKTIKLSFLENTDYSTEPLVYEKKYYYLANQHVKNEIQNLTIIYDSREYDKCIPIKTDNGYFILFEYAYSNHDCFNMFRYENIYFRCDNIIFLTELKETMIL
jgi:hypothetical protein